MKEQLTIGDEVDNGTGGDGAGGGQGETLAVHEGDDALADPKTGAHGGEEIVVVHGAVEEGDKEESDRVAHSCACRCLWIADKANHISSMVGLSR